MSSAIEASAAPSETAPTPGVSERISSLDVTRGFAVMGILLMNIITFAMPATAYITPRAWGGDSGIDLWSWAANYVLIDSKMRGLFSIMFGASTLLVIERARAGGLSGARAHYGRMVVLALFGLIHFFFIWWGDILFLYAVMGMILYGFRNLSARALVAWAVAIGLLALVMSFAQFGSLLLSGLPGMPPELVDTARYLRESKAPMSAVSRDEVALVLSGFWPLAEHQLNENWYLPLAGLLLFGPETLALMLIGMALFRSGLLRGQWTLGRLVKWRNVCLAIGITANLGLLWWQFQTGLDPLALMAATFTFSVPFDVVMSVGYAALFMALAQRFADAPFIRRVGAAGQAAFTNYLGTSILMTFIFYGWGLGLFGSINRAACYLFVLAAWVIMLLWSKPWLERYRYGPLEWLWRSLSRGRIEPIRR